MSVDVQGLSETGLWQLVEYADYRADLEIWQDLAAASGGPILDLGCGIGRVAHHLAGLGYEVVGVDRDPEVVEDFNRSRPNGEARAVAADVTRLFDPTPPLLERRFPLVIAPQQLVQLLGGPRGRLSLFSSLHRLLGPGGTAAFAICEDLPRTEIEFPGVLPDMREVGDWVYASLPVAIDPGAESITSRRLRQSVSPEGAVAESEYSVRIDRLDRGTLDRELGEAGFTVTSAPDIPETERHMGSTVVIAGPPDA